MMMIIKLMIMIMMIIIIIILIIITTVMNIFLSAFPCETCSIVLNKCKYKNTKHMHIRHLKQHVSKQSCSNIQLSSKDGYKK